MFILDSHNNKYVYLIDSVISSTVFC